MITTDEILKKPVQALNLKQPFAELMLHDEKQETRTWNTNYRGLVLIVASVQVYGDRELIDICGPEQYARVLQVLGPKWFNQVKRGSAIAIGRLVRTGTMAEFDEQKTFVKHKPGLYIHYFEDVTPIKTFPFRGALGYRPLTEEQKKLIKPLDL